MMLLHCASFQEYSLIVAAKSAARIDLLKSSTAHNRANAVFLCVKHCYTLIMVGWAGASKDAPVSVEAGKVNPVQLTTSQIDLCGGDGFTHSTEANIMATNLDLSFACSTPDLQIVDGKILTSSLAVAAFFQKEHKNVLRAIQSIECTSDFRQLNFEQTSYFRQNPNGGDGIATECYNITRDGFTFLAMGFTGKKAAMFKEAYITAFNSMEAKLRSSEKSCPRTRVLMTMEGDTISNIVPVPISAAVIDTDNFKDVFSALSLRMSPADLVNLSQLCMSRLVSLAEHKQ